MNRLLIKSLFAAIWTVPAKVVKKSNLNVKKV